MAVQLQPASVSHAKALIRDGKVNADAAWSLTPEDENALLGDNDWQAYSKWFLAEDTDAAADTKARYKYPYGKDGNVYRAALIAIRQRAGQQGVNSVFDAAGELRQLIDKDAEAFAELVAVDVFRPGTWHGRTYTNADMLTIANNSNRLAAHRAKLRWEDPALKLSHAPSSSFYRHAAFGVSSRFYTRPVKLANGKSEDRVFVDFQNVPDVVATAVRDHFPDRSVEKYTMIRDPLTGEEVTDVIASVAFLGAIPPEVKALSDRYAVLFESSPLTQQFQYTEGEPRMIDQAKVKDRWVAGATAEDLLKEFEGLTPEELAAWIDEWKAEKAAAEKPADQPKEKPAEKMSAFSEAQVMQIVTAALKKQASQQQSQVEQFQARISELETQAAAAKHDANLAWYQQVKANGLPPALDTLDPVAFMERLDSQNLVTFGESQDTMQAQFKQMIEQFASLYKLTGAAMVSPEMKATPSQQAQRDAMIQKYQTAHPEWTMQQILLEIAGADPAVFTA